jgi:uncharacterized protein YjiS (DUF1127 family)
MNLYLSSSWNQAKHRFAEWRGYLHLQHEMMNLSDRILRDIGVSRRDDGHEASKPFWLV